MNTLEKLIQIAQDENITIDYTDYLPYNLEGLHINLEGIGHIISILHRVKNDKDKYIEILGEELGHYFTSVGDNLIKVDSYRDYLKICKTEKKALDWSVNVIIKNSDLERAFKNNCASYYDVAEFLNVPEKLVREKFKYLASKNINGYVSLGEYKVILTNLPNVLIYKNFNY